MHRCRSLSMQLLESSAGAAAWASAFVAGGHVYSYMPRYMASLLGPSVPVTAIMAGLSGAPDRGPMLGGGAITL